jgi:hypothetical protein
LSNLHVYTRRKTTTGSFIYLFIPEGDRERDEQVALFLQKVTINNHHGWAEYVAG